MAGPTAFPASAIVSGTLDRQRIPAVENYGISLAKFRRAIDGLTEATGKRNVVVLVLGDSLASRVASRVMEHWTANLGIGGPVYSMLGTGGSVDGISRSVSRALDGGATETTGNNTYLPTGRWVTLDASGEAVRFFNSSSQTNSATTIKVYYVKEPGAGTFSVDTGTAIASNFTERVASVDANDAGSPSLGVVTISLPQASYSIRVNWLSGAVKILDVAWVDSTAGRIDQHSLAVGGQDPAIYNTVNASMMTALIADINPDVVMSMWDDNATNTAIFADRLKEWIDSSGIVPPLVMMFGSGPKNGSDATIAAQNALLAQESAEYGWAFVNGFVALGSSWATLNAIGWGGDGTHLNDRAYSHLASIMLSQIGFSFEPKVIVRGLASYQDSPSVRVRQLAIARNADTTPGGLFSTDSSTGSDITLQVRNNRAMRFVNESGTLFAAISHNHTVLRSVIPSGFALGATTGPQIISGSANPEGSVTAPVGSLYMCTSGGAGTTLYVKESGTGNTGWMGK